MGMEFELIRLLDLLLHYSSKDFHGNDKRIGWEWVPLSQTFTSWQKSVPSFSQTNLMKKPSQDDFKVQQIKPVILNEFSLQFRLMSYFVQEIKEPTILICF